MGCLSEESETLGVDAARAVVDVAVLAAIVVSNCAILAVVARRWTSEGMPLGNVTSSLLVINLSAADALVGALSFFHFLPRYCCPLAEAMRNDEALCVSRFALVLTAHLASGYTLVAIAVDRYVAVVHAVHYRDLFTPRRTLLLMASIWALAAAGACILYGWNKWGTDHACYEFNTLPLAYIVGVGLVGQFLIMGTVTLAHWRIHKTVLTLRSRGGCGAGAFSPADKVGTRAARMLLFILVVYISAWAPFMAMLMVRTTGIATVPRIAMEIASSIVNVNYLVNPFIYAYNNRPIRKTMKRFMRSVRRRAFDPNAEVSYSGTKTG